MQNATVFLIVIILILLCMSSTSEPYSMYFARTKPPNVSKILQGYPDHGGLCIGYHRNWDGQQLKLSTDCTDFRGTKGVLPNNQLVAGLTGNHVSAYHNAKSDGQPLEFTTKWRDQKFSFDKKGTDSDGTIYGTIRHIESGKCLHPEGGSASHEGQRLVVWGDCSPQDRIMFNVYPSLG